MATLDIFNGDAFSLTSLSSAIERTPYLPTFLGSLGIFTPEPVRQRSIWVDERDGELNLIQTSPNGAPPKELDRDTRKARAFQVPRIAKGTTLYAAEIAGLRAFGSESEQTVVMTEYMRRLQRVRNDLELTKEHMRLGALKGTVVDADGSTVIYNYFTEFGIAAAADQTFDFTNTTADFPAFARGVKRGMIRSSKGAIPMTASIHAIAGDGYFDAIISHPSVSKLWLNWQAAAELRGIDPFESFTVGGVTFHNYRGTDDNSTVAVATNKAHFFPIGAPGVFSEVMAPADEFIPYVGAPGQSVYAMTIRDRDRDAWVRGELYSYPLFMCKRPEILRVSTGTLA